MRKKIVALVLALCFVLVSVLPALASVYPVQTSAYTYESGLSSYLSGSSVVMSYDSVQDEYIGKLSATVYAGYGPFKVDVFDQAGVLLHDTPNVTDLTIPFNMGSAGLYTAGSTYSVKVWGSYYGRYQIFWSFTAGNFAFPTVPTGVSLSGTTLIWSANPSGDNVLNYNIYDNGILLTTLNATSYTLSGLSVGTHSITVSAVNSVGESGKSAAVSYVVESSASTPTGLTISGSGGSGTLTWVANPASDNITSYNIYVNGTKIASSTLTSYVFSGYGNGSYSFAVSAVNSLGESLQSTQVSYIVLGVPGQVMGVTVSGSGAPNGVLTWIASPSSDNVMNYNIYDSSSLLAQPVTNSYSFSSLTVGLHNFQVSAVNATGEGALSDMLAYTVVAAPGAVTLTSSNLSSNSIDLAWNSEGAGANYSIYENGFLIGQVSDPVLAYHVSGLIQNTSYSFYVVATNVSGASPASNSVEVTTPIPVVPVPGQVQGLTVTGQGNGYVNLGWSANPTSDNVTKYNIYVNGQAYQSVVGSATSAQVTGLANNKTYSFSVTAVNSGGESIQSTSVQGTSAIINTQTSTFYAGVLSLGVNLKDVFVGTLLFLAQLWPIIALGIAITLAFALARRTKLLGRLTAEDEKEQGYFGNKKLHKKNGVKLARKTTKRKLLGGRRLARGTVKYGVKKVSTVGVKKKQRQKRHGTWKLGYLSKRGRSPRNGYAGRSGARSRSRMPSKSAPYMNNYARSGISVQGGYGSGLSARQRVLYGSRPSGRGRRGR